MLGLLLFAFFEAKRFFVPCPIKWLTGVDCPGCGFQRSLYVLIQGEFEQSFKLYPPTMLFLLSFFATAMVYSFKWNADSKWLKILYFGTGIVVVINYLFKLMIY